MADAKTKIATATGLGLTILGNTLGIVPGQQTTAQKLLDGGESVAQTTKQSQDNKGLTFEQTTIQRRQSCPILHFATGV